MALGHKSLLVFDDYDVGSFSYVFFGGADFG
jgi:hypothetical protein